MPKKIISSLPGKKSDVNDFFIDTICASGYEYLACPVANDLTLNEARAFMENVVLFQQAGWAKLLEG